VLCEGPAADQAAALCLSYLSVSRPSFSISLPPIFNIYAQQKASSEACFLDSRLTHEAKKEHGTRALTSRDADPSALQMFELRTLGIDAAALSRQGKKHVATETEGEDRVFLHLPLFGGNGVGESGVAVALAGIADGHGKEGQVSSTLLETL
jgi:hypothetical protein